MQRDSIDRGNPLRQHKDERLRIRSAERAAGQLNDALNRMVLKDRPTKGTKASAADEAVRDNETDLCAVPGQAQILRDEQRLAVGSWLL